MYSENVTNGDVISIGLAVAVTAFLMTTILMTQISNEETEPNQLLIKVSITIVGGIVGFFVLWYVLLAILQPGDNVWPVDTPEEASVKVSAGRLTFGGLFSYALYRVFGREKTVTVVE